MKINSSAPRISVPFSTNGAKNTIPVNASDTTLASYAIGFPPITAIPVESGGVAPTCQDFNGIFYDLSNAIMWLQAMGILPWDSTVSYPNGAFVSYNGDMYYSVVDDNVGITPGTNDAKWISKKSVVNSSGNSIKFGWNGSAILGQVDDKVLGYIIFDKELREQLALKQDLLGYTPVQQGTGIGQLQNIIKIGWNGSAILGQVDDKVLGYIIFDKELREQLALKQNLLGYTPVQQGTGIGQLQNIIKIGWDGNRLRGTVDTTELGPVVFDGNLTGQVGYFAMTTPPNGWMKANGAAVPRSAYSSLFAAIGTTFGAGDGSTTFNLPDMRGEFIRGWDDGRGIDSGRTLGTWQADDFKSHKHTTYFADTPAALTYPNGYESTGNKGPAGNGVDNDNAYPYTSNTGGAETRPRNIALLACIKY